MEIYLSFSVSSQLAFVTKCLESLYSYEFALENIETLASTGMLAPAVDVVTFLFLRFLLIFP